MLLRRMLPCDDKRRLTHREFVDGAIGTSGESYAQFRQRVIDTIAREELEVQARGGIMGAENLEEHIFEGDEEDEHEMTEEELCNTFAAIDSGVLSVEQVSVLQKRIQRKGRCYNCGRPGHIAKNCRDPKSQMGKGGGKGSGGKGSGYNPAAGK